MIVLRVMISGSHIYSLFQAPLCKDACHLSRLVYKLIQTFTVNAPNAKLGQMWIFKGDAEINTPSKLWHVTNLSLTSHPPVVFDPHLDDSSRRRIWDITSRLIK